MIKNVKKEFKNLRAYNTYQEKFTVNINKEINSGEY